MLTAAVLPVKRFALAKQRLGAGLDGPLRRRLAEAMVGDVLEALTQVSGLALIIVVTGESDVLRAAQRAGAIVVDEGSDPGQSPAATRGVARARSEGMQRALLIPGDCPTLDPSELAGLLKPRAEREVVIIPDRHGSGTNGLLLTPPDVIAPGFGPGSFERHRERAERTGVPWRSERPPSLLLDIDTGEDLRVLRERLAAGSPRAARARAVLQGFSEPEASATPAAGPR